MVIKVLGPGCANCKKLAENTKKAVEELGLNVEIVKVEGLVEILAYGVMSTPALVVDEKVKVMGRIPTVEEIKKYL